MERFATVVHGTFIAEGGLKAICRHSARSIHHKNDVADFSGLENSARYFCFLQVRSNFEQSREIEPSSHPPELSNLAGQGLLIFNPNRGRWRERVEQSFFCPNGDCAYPRNNWRNDSNSRTFRLA